MVAEMSLLRNVALQPYEETILPEHETNYIIKILNNKSVSIGSNFILDM